MSDRVSLVAQAPPITPEADLLQRYTAGERDALDELVHAYQEPAFWVAWHLVGHDDVAYDLVQDGFLRVLRKSEQYDPSRPFKAWFLQIVRNLAIDWLRRKRAQLAPLHAEIAEVDDGPELESREMGENIQRILARLPERQRELILLRDVEGFSPEEIAGMQDADRSTTRWRLHQARKKFRQLWVAAYGELE